MHNLSYNCVKVDKSSTKYAKSAYFQHIIGVAKQTNIADAQHMKWAEPGFQKGGKLQGKGGVP